jgi:hypothetical protein
MKTTILEKSQIKENPENPRSITEEKLGKLVQSLLDFPEMLFIRPIVVGSKGLSLGGNMRFKAIEEIRDYTGNYKESILEEQKEKRKGQNETQIAEFEEAINHLLFDENFHVVDVSFLSEDKQDEFILKDNIGYGTWDWDVIAHEWDSTLLESWGLDVPKFDESKSASQNKEKETPDEKITITLSYSEEEYELVRDGLSKVSSTPEQAVWKLLKL